MLSISTSSAASCCSMRVMPLPSASFSSTVSMNASSCADKQLFPFATSTIEQHAHVPNQRRKGPTHHPAFQTTTSNIHSYLSHTVICGAQHENQENSCLLMMRLPAWVKRASCQNASR